jgi:hypothetical protein
MRSHDFIEVGNRRWCVGCDLYQQKERSAVYFPTPAKSCPRNTPLAREQDAPPALIASQPDREG